MPADDTSDAVLVMGTEVGVIARQGWPDGTLIAPKGLSKPLAATHAALSARKVVFEATMQQDGVLVRTDVLAPGPAARPSISSR
ncbi:MAG: hypothetical protein ACYCTF_03085 [Acidiferrobacter sp.]